MRRLTHEHGFTMLPAMFAVLTALSLSAGAVTIVSNDSQLQVRDKFTKRAMLAVQTGVADYVQHLAADSDYYSYCDGMAGTHAVNDTIVGSNAPTQWTGPTGTNGKVLRRWQPDPTGATGATTTGYSQLEFQYSIDLLPANGKLACREGTDRVASMIDSTSATFRVRVTGRAGPPIPTGDFEVTGGGGPVANNEKNRELWRQTRWVKRSVVMDFRRRGFLDFAWLTDNESKDPALYSNPSWAETNCSMYFRDGRSSNGCSEIHFVNGDHIKGPFHTNDSILAETGSKFGRSGQNDRIEISADWCPVRGDDGSSSCGNSSPTYYSTPITGVNAPVLPLPEVNEDLATYGDTAFGGLTFTGHTTIELKDGGFDVTNANYNGGVLTFVPYPTSPVFNGVVYVKNGVGCDGYDPSDGFNPSGDANCGLIAIKGTYDRSLTFAAEDDVVITGNITRKAGAAYNDAVIGLIANKFVRIRHYGTSSSGCGGSGTTVSSIQAALLALQHSFLLDCSGSGSSLGTLTVTGVIAQKYRGIIGTGSGSTGYLKDYNYDDRFKYRTPPYFLSPAYSGWRTVRFREQVPSCGCGENYANL